MHRIDSEKCSSRLIARNSWYRLPKTLVIPAIMMTTAHCSLHSFALAVCIFWVLLAATCTHGFTLPPTSPFHIDLSASPSSSASSSLSPSPGRVSAVPRGTALNLKSDGMTAEEREIAMGKATKAMTAFTNTYLKNTDTKLCVDMSVPAVVIKGLAEHKVDLGSPLCPCRFYEDKEAEAKDGYWNCPCVPMRERHECHCMLFLTEDNDFAGEEQVREVVAVPRRESFAL
jgi:ferredoxin-thioredoxin reductase catalytic chain